MAFTVLTVKQLNTYVKSLLDGDKWLSSIYIKGEISNFKDHYQSGHLYFSLKDADSVIKAVMFRSSASYLKFRPADGMGVICRGRVSLYEKDGSYQFYVEEMIPDGAGDLAVAFEQIKSRLESLGYFDSVYKKPIPDFPQKIAVITSKTGAAVQDILNILGRRYPVCDVILCPVLVQGDGAVSDLVNAVRTVREKKNVDLIIIGRGGGSIEDLWAFNSEVLAREIFECEIPVISAVGHETDFTICDFVADLRAPTPSAAAELAVPDMRELAERIDVLQKRIVNGYENYIDGISSRVKLLRDNSVLSRPDEYFESLSLNIDRVSDRLTAAYKTNVDRADMRLRENAAKLDALSPLKVLSRGYSVTMLNGKSVNNAAELTQGDCVSILFRNGTADCTVDSVKNTEDKNGK